MTQGRRLESGHQAPTPPCSPLNSPFCSHRPTVLAQHTPTCSPSSLPFPAGCREQDGTPPVIGNTATSSASLAAHSPRLSGFCASQLPKGCGRAALASPVNGACGLAVAVDVLNMVTGLVKEERKWRVPRTRHGALWDHTHSTLSSLLFG